MKSRVAQIEAILERRDRRANERAAGARSAANEQRGWGQLIGGMAHFVALAHFYNRETGKKREKT